MTVLSAVACRIPGRLSSDPEGDVAKGEGRRPPRLRALAEHITPTVSLGSESRLGTLQAGTRSGQEKPGSAEGCGQSHKDKGGIQ